MTLGIMKSSKTLHKLYKKKIKCRLTQDNPSCVKYIMYRNIFKKTGKLQNTTITMKND